MNSLKHIVSLAVVVLCFFSGTQSASALTISPVKVEVAGDPGQTLRGELDLLNEQPGSKTLFSTFENFEPSGETGSPKFVGGATGLATWLGAQQSVTVDSAQTVKVPYTITIPTDAEPGGYFAAIFWGEQDPGTKQAGEVAIGGKLGVLILLRVNGAITEAAGISDFGLGAVSKLRTTLPVAFSYRFKNDGGDRVVPLGDISIINTFGGVAATIPANPTEGSVLPNSMRKFQSVWGAPQNEGETQSFVAAAKAELADFHFGVYTAKLSVTYGATNQIATDSFRFFMVPWQLLLIVGAGLILIIFSFKRYNAWIIAKSKSRA